MTVEVHIVDDGLYQVIGRCEPCDLTLNGTAGDHLGAAHPDEMYECWTDPESGAWTILRRAPEFEVPEP